MRENQGVKLIRELGFDATQVVDPTLLVNSSLWEKFKDKKVYKKKRLLCYTLAENLLELLPKLEKFAKDNDCDVVVFPDRFEKRGCKPKSFLNVQKLRLRLLTTPVKVYISAAIEDFMREISAATWIVTNSYHAMMFSVIYRKNIRIIVPTDKVRQGMHARMQEFAGTIIDGPLMQANVEDALSSCERGEEISINEVALKERIKKSRIWLKTQIENIENAAN